MSEQLEGPLEGDLIERQQVHRFFPSLDKLYGYALTFGIDHALIDKGKDQEGNTIYSLTYHDKGE